MKGKSMHLSLLVLKTDQIEQVRNFYQGLGLAFQEEKHGNGPIHFSARIQDTVVEIYPLPKAVPQADMTTRLGFRIENLDATIQKLKEKGGKVVSEAQPKGSGFAAIVKDPDGRSVELTQE
jgi:predicted enzyme related to lactoylglutathione lyase